MLVSIIPLSFAETVITITGDPNPTWGKIYHYIIHVDGKLYNNGISQFAIYEKNDSTKSGQQFSMTLYEGENRFGLNLLDYGYDVYPYTFDTPYIMEIVNLNNVGIIEFTPRNLEEPADTIDSNEVTKNFDTPEPSCISPTFCISLRPAEGWGKFEENVIDLGTIMYVEGTGAFQTDVIITIEDKHGRPSEHLTHGFSEGVFGTQFFFTTFNDVGNYKVTALNVNTGEEMSLEFSVAQLENPELAPVESFQSQTDIKIKELEDKLDGFEEKILELEDQIEKKDGLLMEQLRVIENLASVIQKTIFEPILNYFAIA